MKMQEGHRSEVDIEPVSQPGVGMFFYFDGHLWIDATPVENAAAYGNFKTHDRGHEEFWQHLRNAGRVPPEVEYDEVPRGRVSYDTKSAKFLLLLDRCILVKPELVDEIISRLKLPLGTPASRDLHYRCPACCGGRNPLDDQ